VASAWGAAWGAAFGLAFGAIDTPQQQPDATGAASGYHARTSRTAHSTKHNVSSTPAGDWQINGAKEGTEHDVGNLAAERKSSHADLVAQAVEDRHSELRRSGDVLETVVARLSEYSSNPTRMDEASLRTAESLRGIDAERVALNAARDDEEMALLMILLEAA
jgi:hypothetical protein